MQRPTKGSGQHKPQCGFEHYHLLLLGRGLENERPHCETLSPRNAARILQMQHHSRPCRGRNSFAISSAGASLLGRSLSCWRYPYGSLAMYSSSCRSDRSSWLMFR